MRKRNMIMAICAIITMGLAIPLGAQSITAPQPQSNQKTATASVFSTDVDNYMSVKSFDKVNFERWFGFFGGNSKGNVNAGYATNLGSIYLGGFYTGRIIDTGTDETKTRTTTWDKDLQQQLTQTDETKYGDGWTNTTNNITAFIGVAGMGIKLGFYEDVSTANTPYKLDGRWPSFGDTSTSTVTKNQDGSITYSGNDSINYEESKGNMSPYLQWGMKINAGDYVLAPRISGQVDINRDMKIDEYYSQPRTELDGKIVGVKEIKHEEVSAGSVGLNLGVGADFYLKDTTFIGIDYAIGLNFNGQDYKGAIKSGSVKGAVDFSTVSGTEDYFDKTKKYNNMWIGSKEIDEISHLITPSFWNTNVVRENLKVGMLVKVPIIIASNSTSSYEDWYEVTETTYNDPNRSRENTTESFESHTPKGKVETSYFAISPTIGIGASYAMVPDKFTVNAGVNLKPIKYVKTSTVTSQNGINSTYSKKEVGSDNSKYTEKEEKTVNAPTTIEDTVNYTSEWTGLSGSISAGFVFKFYDFFSLDLLATGGSSNSGFNLSLTDVNVLFSIKF